MRRCKNRHRLLIRPTAADEKILPGSGGGAKAPPTVLKEDKVMAFFNSAIGVLQTLVVALFADVNAPGYRPIQMIDALAVIFFVVTVILFIISMKFGSPTSVYSQIGSEK